jgi:hypothetical protein
MRIYIELKIDHFSFRIRELRLKTKNIDLLQIKMFIMSYNLFISTLILII